MSVSLVMRGAQKTGLMLLIASAVMLVIGGTASATEVDSAAHPDAIPQAESDFISAMLAAYRWDLSKAYGPDGAEQSDWKSARTPVLSLGFSAGSFGTSVCNSLNWSYTLTKDGGIELQSGMSTAMACFSDVDGDAVMKLESRVGAQLSMITKYDLQIGKDDYSNRLVLRFKDGSQWELVGVPSEETSYGLTGQIVQFEVEPKLVPCDDPKSIRRMCM